MLSLLLILGFGCGQAVGNDATVYDACLTWTEIACACGNIESDQSNPQWYCDAANVEGTCDRFDMAYCDTQSADFDAARCETVHDAVTPDMLDWLNCVNAVYADECADSEAECGQPPQ